MTNLIGNWSTLETHPAVLAVLTKFAPGPDEYPLPADEWKGLSRGISLSLPIDQKYVILDEPITEGDIHFMDTPSGFTIDSRRYWTYRTYDGRSVLFIESLDHCDDTWIASVLEES
jgi:hypothetical protein